MKKDNGSIGGQAITRRKALGAFGAAGAAMLAAVASPTVQAQSPTPAPPTAAASATALASATPISPPTLAPRTPTPMPIVAADDSLEHYQSAWLELRALLDKMTTQYSALPLIRIPGSTSTVLRLISALKQFGEGQFNFFYNGFHRYGEAENRPNLYPTLLASDDFSPQQTLAITLAQISEDITIIRQIVDQRALELLDKTPNDKQLVLQSADSLAESAMWPEPPYSPPPVSSSFDLEAKTVLTYFKKSTDVRVVPYANVALVGIPFESLGDWRKFLAIPHEIGHFHYWYSRPAKKDNNDNDDNNRYTNIRESDPFPIRRSGRYDHWGEEMFADIYGTLVAGPLSILTGMDLALEHSAREFSNFSSDDDHPTPLVRPVIMLKALANFSFEISGISKGEREEVAHALLKRWEERLVAERSLSLNQLAIPDLSWTIDIDPSKKVDAKIAQYLAELDAGPIKALGWGWAEPIRVNDNIDTELESYVEQFRLHKDRVLSKVTSKKPENWELLPGLPVFSEYDAEVPPLWKYWVFDAKQYLTKLAPDEKFEDRTLAAGEFPKDMTVPPEAGPTDNWIRVFGAGGWTTGGPCTSRR